VAAGPRWFGPQAKAGLLRARLGCRAGPETACTKKVSSFFFFQNPIPLQNKQTNTNSNRDLNPSTRKQCSGMYATVNSYISLIT
jgi:hypothetical protein